MWKRVESISDQPDKAGYEVLVTLKAKKSGQLRVTTAFTGYGDYKWYTNDYIYMQDPHNGNNKLHEAFEVIAWAEPPQPYNPYLIDGRRVIEHFSERIRTERSTIEIKKDLISFIDGLMDSGY